MKTMTILATVSLAVIITACCPCRRQTNAIPLTGTLWSLTQLNGERVDSKNFNMTLAADGKIAGIGDCNRFSGTFSSKATKGGVQGEITVNENLVSTRMMCLNQPLEDSFLRMLREVDSWNIDGERLMLIKNGDVLAIFENVTATTENTRKTE